MFTADLYFSELYLEEDSSLKEVKRRASYLGDVVVVVGMLYYFDRFNQLSD